MALGRTVEELEHTISRSELDEWREFLADEPLPAQVREFQLAALSVISTGNKDAKLESFMISGKKSKGEAKAPKKSLTQKATGFVKDMFF